MKQLEMFPSLADASSVDGKENSIRRVDRTNVQDVSLLLQRTEGDRRTQAARALLRNDQGVLIWGDTGYAILHFVSDLFEGKIAWITFWQGDTSVWPKKVMVEVNEWAKERGMDRVAGAVSRQAPWYRVTGMKPWKLIIAKEVS